MADALASGASVRKDVGVQVPPSAPIKVLTEVRAFFVFNGKCKPKTKYRLTMARKYGLIASDKNCSVRGQHESTRNENREIGRAHV